MKIIKENDNFLIKLKEYKAAHFFLLFMKMMRNLSKSIIASR